MSLEDVSGALRWAVACLVLAAPVLGAPAQKANDAKADAKAKPEKNEKNEKNKADDAEEPKIAPTPRPIRLVAAEVIKRALLAAPADTSRRISVKGGLLGLGGYTPRGGDDLGAKSAPRYLFPQAGTGNSLNVDPMTGHSYFTNTP
jgi:hypothetical protein